MVCYSIVKCSTCACFDNFTSVFLSSSITMKWQKSHMRQRVLVAFSISSWIRFTEFNPHAHARFCCNFELVIFKPMARRDTLEAFPGNRYFFAHGAFWFVDIFFFGTKCTKVNLKRIIGGESFRSHIFFQPNPFDCLLCKPIVKCLVNWSEWAFLWCILMSL